MLVTDPAHRATLSEVMASPWLNKGYETPANSYLVPREPLRSEELDTEVLRGMAGFEFGSEDTIRHRMTELLMSDTYRRVQTDWETRRTSQRRNRDWTEGSSGTEDASILGNTTANSNSSLSGVGSSPRGKPQRRFSGFDFYKNRLFKTGSAANGEKDGRIGGNGLLAATHPEEQEPLDPTRGFHPLISIYYLVREKMERERVYGPGLFASSELSLDQPPTGLPNGAQPNNGRAPAYGMNLPRLSVPETSHIPAHRGSDAVRAMPTAFDAHARTRGESLPQRDRVEEARAAGVMQHPEEDFERSRVDQLSPGPSANGSGIHRRSYSLSAGPNGPPESQGSRIVSSASQYVRTEPDVKEEEVTSAVRGVSLKDTPEVAPSRTDSPVALPVQAPRPSGDSRSAVVEVPATKPSYVLPREDDQGSSGGSTRFEGASASSTKVDAKPVYLKGLFR
jgi:hypothetical protein